MNNNIENTNKIAEKPVKNKKYIAIDIAVIICSLCVIVLALLYIFRVMENANLLYQPLIGIVLLLQSARMWKTNRGIAVFSLAAGIFSFAVAVFNLVLFIK